MTDNEILDEFRAADALLEGHFILSSGLRSPRYLQCARVLMDPARAEKLARALAAKLPAEIRDEMDVVISPAMGGVIIGHEVGRALQKPAMFVERPDGVFELRRGFRLDPGARVLLVEDVVTTGLSSREAIAAVEAAGGTVVRTPVGDKYILEGMQVSGAVLGGEKSGHVIVLEHTTSGDGIVTALEVLRVMTSRGSTLAELAAAIPMLPQQQRAVKARHKDQWEGDPVLGRAIAEATARLAGSGRVLVRPSGTEPALRVMVEGPDEALVAELADALAALAGERLN
jgi:orotate phosphoribosyltransferase